jgi:hypothetical protein
VRLKVYPRQFTRRCRVGLEYCPDQCHLIWTAEPGELLTTCHVALEPFQYTAQAVAVNRLSLCSSILFNRSLTFSIDYTLYL